MHDPEYRVLELAVPSWKKRELLPGKSYRLTWFRILDVWHDEPGGGDIFTVCERAPQNGSGRDRLTWPWLVWAWRHREHLQFRWAAARRVRRWFLRCAECGRRFRRKDAVTGYMSSDDKYHQECMALRQARRQLEDARRVLAAIPMEAWPTGSEEDQRAKDATWWTRVWRVKHAIERTKETQASG